MAPVNKREIFENAIEISLDNIGGFVLSEELTELLLLARQAYDWPRNTGAAISQQTIIETKAACGNIVKSLNLFNVQSLLARISQWGGNNERANQSILTLTNEEKLLAIDQIQNLSADNDISESILNLTTLPGIDLVMASKIYRFCSENGAALDRHSSYFFNSLPVAINGEISYSTNFKREWTDGRHISSRLAIYSLNRRIFNLDIYINQYLPILDTIASYLNNSAHQYHCIVENIDKEWKVADVEMAAYYWWALHGSR